MINIMLYSTSHTEYRPNWRGGGNSVSSQQSVVRDRNAWETSSSQKVPKNWLSINQREKSMLLIQLHRPSQRAPVNTDEINELAQGRMYSRHPKSPPLHLYTILKQCLAIVLLVIDSDQNACKTVIASWIAEDAQIDLFIDATSDIEIRKFAESMGIPPLLVPGKFRLHRMSEKTMYNLGIRSLPHVVTGTESIQ